VPELEIIDEDPDEPDELAATELLDAEPNGKLH
jgi:hypothetical protein